MSNEDKYVYISYGLLGVSAAILLYLIFNDYVKKYLFENFSNQVPKKNKGIDRIPKLSPEQQSVILESVVRSEYDDMNKSLLGGVPSKKDSDFLLTSGSIDNMLLHNMKCSKSCCGQQWPVPHDINKDPNVCGKDGDYVPTNMTCSNEYTTGCTCVPRKVWKFLAAKGGNGSFNDP